MTATGQPVGSPEKLFLEHLPVIDRIIAIIAHRNALAAHDADDFAAWARGRLADGDYAILRKFAGRSSLQTYLSVVLSNLYRDYRNSAWGRWRPSATATRLGPVGIRMEELLSRDGCSLREAIGILRSAGAQHTDTELARLAARLPQRPVARDVALEEARESLPAAAPPSSGLADDRARVEQALEAAIGELPDEDRVITRMRFWDALSVADIARALGLEQKPLYRRLEIIQRRLKVNLERHGVSEQHARDLLTEEGLW